MSQVGIYRFLGSNGQMSGAFPLTVLSESELKDKEVIEDFNDAKSIDSRIDSVAFIEFPEAGIQHKPCCAKLLPAGYKLK